MTGAPETTSRLADIVLSLVFLGLAIVGFLAVPQMVSGWGIVIPGMTDASLSPTFFPRLAMACLGLVAGTVLIGALRRQDEILPLFELTGEEWARVVTALVLIAAYAAMVRTTGFVTSSGVFILAMSYLAGYRNHVAIVATAIVAPLATWAIFRMGLQVLLPVGTLFGSGHA